MSVITTSGSTVKVIDVHAHIIPPCVGEPGLTWSWMGNPLERGPDGRLATTTGARAEGFQLAHEGLPEGVRARLDHMDSVGVDMQVLSLLPSLWMYGVEGHDSVAAARRANDDLIAIAEANRSRFRAFAHLPLDQPALAVEELERVMPNETIVGAAVGTNVPGSDWDSAQLYPVLEAAERLGALLFFHPMTVRFPPKPSRRYHLGNLIGNPSDTTLAIAHLIFGGALDRLPELKLVFAHGGGYGCFAIGRFDHGHDVRTEAREHIQAHPSTYLRRMYFDNLVFSDTATRYLIETAGLDRVVLGTDYPADMGPEDPARPVAGSPAFTEEEVRAILGGNLIRLLGLEGATIGAAGAG